MPASAQISSTVVASKSPLPNRRVAARKIARRVLSERSWRSRERLYGCGASVTWPFENLDERPGLSVRSAEAPSGGRVKGGRSDGTWICRSRQPVAWRSAGGGARLHARWHADRIGVGPDH